MSYVNHAQDPARRVTAIAGVVAVHTALAVVLITGLRFTGIIPTDDYTPIIEFPTPPEPPPPPQTDEKVMPEVPKSAELIAPQPPIDLVDLAPVKPKVFDPLDIPDRVVIPQPSQNLVDPPKPKPIFAPKSAAPRGDTSHWVTTQDYPSSALRQEAEGTTHFRVIVGTDGRVDACEVTRSSGHAKLDQATCKNVERRARFDAATDGSGQKVVGSYTSSVSWRIPD